MALLTTPIAGWCVFADGKMVGLHELMAPPAVIVTVFSEVATETTPAAKHAVTWKKGSHAEIEWDACQGTRCEQTDGESKDIPGK